MNYNILILHNLPNFSRTLKSAADYVLCFERYAPHHNYLYQRISEPSTTALQDIRFDAIIFDATALGICRYRPRELYESEKERWSFLSKTDAVKLAFPQDDYHQCNVLDTLFDEWNFDRVYTVLPEHTGVAYPRMTTKDRLELVLTGYVDDLSLREFEPFVRPFEQREIDVGQRVQFYSPLGGRHAQLKGRLAEAVKIAAPVKGLRADISSDLDERKFGDDWLRFLGDCRHVTGAEGGVSVLDPDGLIYDRVYAYLDAHPDASFEEVEAACFPGKDGRYVFSAISPRLFEAAMMRCGQILVEASYLDVLKPFEHYIPVSSDLSDVADALDMTRDVAGALRRIDATCEALIENPEFRYSTLVGRVMMDIDRIVGSRHIAGSPQAEFSRLRSEHERQLAEALALPAPAVASAPSPIAPAGRGACRALSSSLKRLVRAALGWNG